MDVLAEGLQFLLADVAGVDRVREGVSQGFEDVAHGDLPASLDQCLAEFGSASDGEFHASFRDLQDDALHFLFHGFFHRHVLSFLFGAGLEVPATSVGVAALLLASLGLLLFVGTCLFEGAFDAGELAS